MNDWIILFKKYNITFSWSELKLGRFEWRWVFIKHNYEIIKNQNYFDGLLNLNELWLDLGDHSSDVFKFQVESDLEPTEFYTKKNFETQLNIHEHWLKDEYEKIL